MPNNTDNNKRIAKNAFFLYIRMLLSMVVSLFTTRVILHSLGEEDYGIYNTLSGIVVLFVFLNQAMVTTTQRFLNYNLGKGDYKSAQLSFSISCFVHLILGIIISIVAEVIGMWFLYNKMNYPLSRFDAAFWTLQISIVVTFVNILKSPYNACIIAYEKMNFYALISIAEVLLKLIIVYCLYAINFDKLITYNLLLLIVTISIAIIYKKYCNRHFDVTKIKFVKNREMFIKLFNFSSYSLLGNGANAAAQYGVNMIINTFCGVAVNAAVGISNQLSSGIYSFVTNFQVAFNPVLVKTYAQRNLDELKRLIIQTSKFSYYLMLLLCLPAYFYMNDILCLWLGNPPEYTGVFCVWILSVHLVDAISAPLWVTVQASGNIKSYQIITSSIIFLNIPITYLVLTNGYPIYYVFIGKFMVSILAFLYRYKKVNKLINIELLSYSKELILPVLSISILCAALGWCITLLRINYVFSIILLLFTCCIVVWRVGLNESEKKYVKNIIMNKIHKK